MRQEAPEEPAPPAPRGPEETKVAKEILEVQELPAKMDEMETRVCIPIYPHSYIAYTRNYVKF